MSHRTLVRPLLAAFVMLAALSAPSEVGAWRRSPEISALTTFGSGLGSGSTIGPGGALYVTDGNAGSVLRVDRRSGEVTEFATGLPTQVIGIGGAIDVAFVGRTAYVLVTVVGGDIVGGPHIGDAVVGIYRVKAGGSPTVFADIGAWSVANPPTTDFFVTTGVQYAIERYHGGFLVTDGHHNRLLFVDGDGVVHEASAYGNVVPTGLESRGGVWIGELGPVPHVPEDGKVMRVTPKSGTTEVASGASMVVDVERGPRGALYALSQGQWDGVGEGSPALPDTGRLVVVDHRGDLVPVTDADGNEIVLDRPTSLEFVGRTAYVVGLDGDVDVIRNL